jgi:hypothetical protein
VQRVPEFDEYTPVLLVIFRGKKLRAQSADPIFNSRQLRACTRRVQWRTTSVTRRSLSAQYSVTRTLLKHKFPSQALCLIQCCRHPCAAQKFGRTRKCRFTHPPWKPLRGAGTKVAAFRSSAFNLWLCAFAAPGIYRPFVTSDLAAQPESAEHSQGGGGTYHRQGTRAKCFVA